MNGNPYISATEGFLSSYLRAMEFRQRQQQIDLQRERLLSDQQYRESLMDLNRARTQFLLTKGEEPEARSSTDILQDIRRAQLAAQYEFEGSEILESELGALTDELAKSRGLEKREVPTMKWRPKPFSAGLSWPPFEKRQVGTEVQYLPKDTFLKPTEKTISEKYQPVELTEATLRHLPEIQRRRAERKGVSFLPKKLDEDTAREILLEAGGDKEKARRMAIERGYILD